MRNIWTMIGATFLLCGSARAQDMSANRYLAGCKSVATAESNKTYSVGDAFKGGWCAGVLYGVLIENNFVEGNVHFCPPQGVEVGQMAKIAVKYIDGIPQRQNEPIILLAIEAFLLAWPCKN
jgi:hypothetical protein